MDISLPPKHGRKAQKVTVAEANVALARCMEHLGRDHHFANIRTAVAGLLIGRWGLPLAETVRLGRRGVSKRPDGSVSIIIAESEPVTLDPRIASGIARYLEVRDNLVGEVEGFLFPGRPTNWHVNEGTVRLRLKTWDAPVRVLGQAVHRWIMAQGTKS